MKYTSCLFIPGINMYTHAHQLVRYAQARRSNRLRHQRHLRRVRDSNDRMLLVSCAWGSQVGGRKCSEWRVSRATCGCRFSEVVAVERSRKLCSRNGSAVQPPVARELVRSSLLTSTEDFHKKEPCKMSSTQARGRSCDMTVANH